MYSLYSWFLMIYFDYIFTTMRLTCFRLIYCRDRTLIQHLPLDQGAMSRFHVRDRRIELPRLNATWCDKSLANNRVQEYAHIGWVGNFCNCSIFCVFWYFDSANSQCCVGQPWQPLAQTSFGLTLLPPKKPVSETNWSAWSLTKAWRNH